jgi:hypothetical protein
MYRAARARAIPRRTAAEAGAIDDDRRAAFALKGLANLHQHYRASGLHERADAVAALASILVMARTPNRLPGGAA